MGHDLLVFCSNSPLNQEKENLYFNYTTENDSRSLFRRDLSVLKSWRAYLSTFHLTCQQPSAETLNDDPVKKAAISKQISTEGSKSALLNKTARAVSLHKGSAQKLFSDKNCFKSAKFKKKRNN